MIQLMKLKNTIISKIRSCAIKKIIYFSKLIKIILLSTKNNKESSSIFKK